MGSDIPKGELVWSDRCKHLFAIEPQEKISHKKVMQALHLDDRERVQQAIWNAIEFKRDYEVEIRVVWPDGTLHWVLSKGRACYDSSGNATRMSGIVLDITERKRMETELQRAKQEWERTFDSVPDMIAIMDLQYRFIRVNRAMAGRLGMTPEQCAGLHCYQYMHGLTSPPEYCPHARTLINGMEHVAEIHEELLRRRFPAQCQSLI